MDEFKIVEINSLCRVCGYFTSATDVNNHYGCTHPEQEETETCTEIDGYLAYDKNGAIKMGKCYSFSCPLATQADVKDLRTHDKEWAKQYKEATDDYTLDDLVLICNTTIGDDKFKII